jgi:hypothetical protein
LFFYLLKMYTIKKQFYLYQMKTILSILFLFICINANAQTSVAIDFEGDGILDSAKIMEAKDGYKLLITLSSLGNKKIVSKVFMGGQENSLQVTKNVLRMHNQFMRGENAFVFRYDAKLKQVKIIGYDNTQYGNAANDGSGSSSYNLVTGVYVANWNHWNEKKNTLEAMPTVRKKLKAQNYFLVNFGDDMVDKFYKLDEN